MDTKKLRSLLAKGPRGDTDFPGRPRRAVAFLTLVERGQTHILFVKKRETPGYPWSGQIALVGGFVEESDTTDLDAAYRELEEELAIPRSEAQSLGELGFFSTQPSRIGLRVFVALWDGKRKPQPDPTEIDRLVEVSAEMLLDAHVHAGYSGREPRLIGTDRLRYPTDEGTIWGVTARALHAFIEMVRLG